MRDLSYAKREEMELEARTQTGKRRSWWSYGDLKLVFDRSTMKGVWLMGNKSPMPCTFSVEKKTGYLKAACPGFDATLERVDE